MRRIILLLSVVSPLCVAAESVDVFGGFGAEWRGSWVVQRLARKPTVYDVVEEPDGQRVLRATSHAANAGLVHRFEVVSPTEAVLRWRWKVPRSLAARADERSRVGDDYAARVFVVFETSLIPLRTRAINYVWAAREPVGSWFPSPYARNVGLLVVRSGDGDAGQWREETRDVLADYRHFFGEAPTRISAVAVCVDTDNTESDAQAWFAELHFDTKPPPKSDSAASAKR